MNNILIMAGQYKYKKNIVMMCNPEGLFGGGIRI
jgi:hypothetical protein